MTTLTRERSFTAEDLLTMQDGKHFELVDGRLVERQMGQEAGWISGEILALLRNYSRQSGIGWVFNSEVGYQCFGEERQTVRKPDVSFVVRGRLPGERFQRGHSKIAPDLAVEVVSPNDLHSEVRVKISEYRAAGVRLVWVVDPDSRSVEIFRADGSVALLYGGDELTGEEVLPGFRCRVEDLFPPQNEPDALAAEGEGNES